MDPKSTKRIPERLMESIGIIVFKRFGIKASSIAAIQGSSSRPINWMLNPMDSNFITNIKDYPPLTGGMSAISIFSSTIKEGFGKWWSTAKRKDGKPFNK